MSKFQEVAILNIDSLVISELKQTGMGKFPTQMTIISIMEKWNKFHSQQSLNHSTWCNFKNDRMILVPFPRQTEQHQQPSHYTATNAEEAGVDKFYKTQHTF